MSGGKKFIYRQFTFVITLAKRCLKPLQTSTCSHLLDATDHDGKKKKNPTPRLFFNSNRAAVIRIQILIRILIGASILKLTSGFKLRIINSLMYFRRVRFACHNCNIQLFQLTLSGRSSKLKDKTER